MESEEEAWLMEDSVPMHDGVSAGAARMREALGAWGPERVGVKAPMLAVNYSRCPWSSRRMREKR